MMDTDYPKLGLQNLGVCIQMCKGFLFFFFREGEFIILCLYHLMVNGQFVFLIYCISGFTKTVYKFLRSDLLCFVVNKRTDTMSLSLLL